MITLKNTQLPQHFHVMNHTDIKLWGNHMFFKVESLFKKWLVSRSRGEQKVFTCRLHFSWARGRLREMLHVKTLLTVEMNLLLETYQKWFLWYHLPCTFNIFINCVFPFLYTKVNSKEISKRYPFLFFRKYQYFCQDSRLLILKKCMATLNFSLWIPIALWVFPTSCKTFALTWSRHHL